MTYISQHPSPQAFFKLLHTLHDNKNTVHFKALDSQEVRALNVSLPVHGEQFVSLLASEAAPQCKGDSQALEN